MISHIHTAHEVNALRLQVSLEDLPGDQIVSGHPQTGFVELGALSNVDIGIWEHSVGVSTDIETNEVFIVLSGTAIIEFLDSQKEQINVQSGSIVQLEEGMKTRWNVTETLRKIYLAPSA